MKNEAPSSSLKSAFRTLSRWISKVYRGTAPLGIEISPEIKGVMDRMLAVEDEIQEAAAATSFDFELKSEDITPEAINEVAKLRARAHDEAYDILLKSHMAELGAERKDFLTAARQKSREEITKEVQSQDVYINMDLMRDYFKDDARTTAQKYLKGELTEKAKAEFDTHADLMGYSSGDHMAKEFVSTTPKLVEIGKRVEASMKQYADLKDTVAVREQAEDALHNEKSLEVLALETEILRSLQGAPDAKTGKREINRARARLELSLAREQARSLLSEKTVRDATAFTHFFAAERQAAVKVAKAVASKDYYWASVYKQQQLVSPCPRDGSDQA
jgi:hypothetical protein